MSTIARVARICALLLAFAAVSAMAECGGPEGSGRSSGTSEPGSDGGY